MTKRIRKFPFKTILYGAFLLLVYILQSSVFSRFPLFGAKPVIFPMAVAAVALFDGCTAGGVFGLFAGMLCDISMNQPVIQFTLVFTGMGLALGYLADTVFARGFPSYLLWGTLSVIFTGTVQVFGFIVFREAEISLLLFPFIFQAVYSILFLLPVYLIIRWMSRF